MCYCDKSLYSISSCPSLQIPEGDSCEEDGVTYYAQCVCPSQYSQTCDGQNLQGVGEGCTQNGVTKYTSCQCKSGYNMTCSDLGPVTPSDYCLLNGVKYYDNCKICENKCSLANCPTGANCTYEDCSQKYCDNGCATGYIEWCTVPETDCAKLGYTKTVSQCSSGYLKCPYNSAAVFCLPIDKEGNEDISTEALILYGDGSTSDKIISNKTPIGIVFDKTNRLAIALTDINSSGNAGSSTMYWSSGYCDTPNLENCGDSTVQTTSCGTNGRANTDAILASTCNGTTYATNAANNYQPNRCSKSFCQKTKCFLPSLGELAQIYVARNKINNTLLLLSPFGATIPTSYYWSSTEQYELAAYIWKMDDGWRSGSSKTDVNYVRPIIKY